MEVLEELPPGATGINSHVENRQPIPCGLSRDVASALILGGDTDVRREPSGVFFL